MEQLLLSMLEEAKKDKFKLRKLQIFATDLKLYELGSKIRDISRELFPESEEETKSKKEAESLGTLFRMVNLNTDDKTCWLILRILLKYEEVDNNFSLDDASNLLVECNNIYG